jgi:hypothetical protein
MHTWKTSITGPATKWRSSHSILCHLRFHPLGQAVSCLNQQKLAIVVPHPASESHKQTLRMSVVCASRRAKNHIEDDSVLMNECMSMTVCLWEMRPDLDPYRAHSSGCFNVTCSSSDTMNHSSCMLSPNDTSPHKNSIGASAAAQPHQFPHQLGTSWALQRSVYCSAAERKSIST